MPPKKLAPSVRKFLRAGNRATDSGYNVVTDQLAALARNLGTGQAGINALLTSSQARDMAAINRLVRRTGRAARQGVAQTQAQATNRYGSALGGVAETAFLEARAASRATGTIGRAGRAGSRILAQGGQQALDILGAGADEAMASAQFAKEMARKSRYQVTAEQAAEMQFELQKMRMDHRFAMQAMEREYELRLEYETALQEQTKQNVEDPAIYSEIARVMDFGVNSFNALWTAFKQPGATLGSVMAQMQATMGITVNTPEYTVLNAVASAMWNAGVGAAPGSLEGQGYDATRQNLVLDAIENTLQTLYPQNAEQLAQASELFRTKIVNAQVAQAARRASEGGVAATSGVAEPGEVAWEDAGWFDRFKYTFTHPFDFGHPEHFTPPGDLETAIYGLSLGVGGVAKPALSAGTAAASAGSRAATLSSVTKGSGTFVRILKAASNDELLGFIARKYGPEFVPEAQKMLARGASNEEVLRWFGLPGI